MKKFVSLNVKLFLLALMAAIVPSVIVGVAMYRNSIGIVERKQEMMVRGSFQSISDTVSLNLKYARTTSLNIISDDNVQKALSWKDPSSDVRIRQGNQIMDSLKFYTGLTSYTKGILLSGHNGIEVSIGRVYEAVLQENLSEIEAAHGGAVWKWKKEGDSTDLILLRELRNIDAPSISLGYLQIVTDCGALEEQLDTFLEAYPGYVALWERDGTEVLNRGTSLQDTEILTRIFPEGNAFERERHRGVLTYSCGIRNTGWVLTGSMLTSDLFSENHEILLLLLSAVIAAFGICFAGVYLFAGRITRPLRELTEQTREISKGNYKIHLNINSNDEIGILNDHFNEMASRLDELVNEVLLGKMLQQEAQYNALQAQIDPHFLYNNLDTAYWMSRMEKAETTGKILLALSALYRSAASTEGKIISVDDEVKNVSQYLTLQELRLGSQIHFFLETEESARNLSTLRFILQPLIENSIEHGILATGGSGTVSVRIYRKNEYLYYVITDSGKGTSAQEITELLLAEQIQGHRGMAIRNIHQRLRIKYGSEYGLIFTDAPAGGLITTVRQPAVEYKKNSEI